MCVTSGQVIEVFVLFFFYFLMGLPKTSVWFRYIFEAGRMTVCVSDLWPGD